MARARKVSVGDNRAERVIAFIERYLIVPEGAHVGRPVRLREWQKNFIRAIYTANRRVRRAILSMARKNGKTSLIAMIVLAHLVGPEARRNGQIYSAAQSREQAAIVFGLASKMVRMSPVLNGMVVVRDSAKELFCPSTGVRYKALSADATTAYGLSPVLVIHDELGQVRGPRSELYEALETAMGAQEAPLSLVISTQAPTDADLLSTLIDDARKVDDGRTVLVLHTADPDDDPWSEETWRKANPALGDFRSLDEMRDAAEMAKRLPAQEAAFRNLYLNQRVAAEDHFLSPAVWAINADAPDLSVFDDVQVCVGADLSATQDLTAVVAVARDGQGIWHIRPWFFLPGEGLRQRADRDRVPYDLWARDRLIVPTPGRTVDMDFVAETITPALRGMNVSAFGYDRWQIDLLKRALARQGYEPPFVEFGQGYKSMTPALKTLETLAIEGRLRHGGHPILTMCAANARVVIDDAGNRKLTKRRSTGRIDGIIALAIALGMAETATQAATSPWDDPTFKYQVA